MLKCPKCKEPIGDNLETCPICFHKITDHERVLMMKARDKEMDKENEDEMRAADEACRRASGLRARGVWLRRFDIPGAAKTADSLRYRHPV